MKKNTKIIEETEEIPNESENSNIWSKIQKWFQSYMNSNSNNNIVIKKDENIKIISSRNELIPDEKFVDVNNNETFESFINSVLDSINMTNIRNEMANLKAIIAESQRSKTNFKHLIFLLISLSLLTYSCNFVIMYCLYPKADELFLSNQEKNMSVENIYNDIQVQYVAG